MMNWKERLEAIICEIIKEKELYDSAVHLYENSGAGKKTASLTVCLWERDYPFYQTAGTPDRNFSIVNISEKPKSNELKLVMGTGMLRAGVLDEVPMPSDMVKSDTKNIYWSIPKDSENLDEYLRSLVVYAVDSYESRADAFGCCCKFEECSDAGKCLHENRLYAKACSYRKNLESGRVFYGSNKNS